MEHTKNIPNKTSNINIPIKKHTQVPYDFFKDKHHKSHMNNIQTTPKKEKTKKSQIKVPHNESK